eukprot:scaffold3815_cov251-Pinguiococcus_pyrenoidosus.AAC.7
MEETKGFSAAHAVRGAEDYSMERSSASSLDVERDGLVAASESLLPADPFSESSRPKQRSPNQVLSWIYGRNWSGGGAEGEVRRRGAQLETGDDDDAEDELERFLLQESPKERARWKGKAPCCCGQLSRTACVGVVVLVVLALLAIFLGVYFGATPGLVQSTVDDSTLDLRTITLSDPRDDQIYFKADAELRTSAPLSARVQEATVDVLLGTAEIGQLVRFLAATRQK